MAPVILRPDVRLQQKLLLIVLLAAAFGVLVGFLFLALIFTDVEIDNPILVALVISVAANALWFVPTLLLIPPYCRSLQYEIQDDEVIVRGGIITKSVKHVPFRTVTNLTVMQGPLDRLFGIGTLNIQTAGMSGQTGAEESLVGLPNFREIYEQVAAALRRYRGSLSPAQSEEEFVPPAAGGDNQLLEEILQELQGIRAALERDG